MVNKKEIISILNRKFGDDIII